MVLGELFFHYIYVLWMILGQLPAASVLEFLYPNKYCILYVDLQNII